MLILYFIIYEFNHINHFYHSVNLTAMSHVVMCRFHFFADNEEDFAIYLCLSMPMPIPNFVPIPA